MAPLRATCAGGCDDYHNLVGTDSHFSGSLVGEKEEVEWEVVVGAMEEGV